MPDGDAASPTDAERERLSAALRRHVAHGHIDLDEFDRRVTRLYLAETRAQAREVLDGLPAVDVPPASPARGSARKRHGEDSLEPHWVATEEVFRDPSSGRVMRVWIDPTDGSRHYGIAD